MPVDIDTSELEPEFEAMSKELAQEAARRWHSWYTEYLLEHGDRYDYDLFGMAQATLPPQWDPGAGGYRWSNPHPAAHYFEDGTAPHEVTPSQADALAFEWPDAPPAIQEMFEDTFPLVFFQKVEVDGIRRSDALKRSERDVIRWMEGQ